MAFVDLLLRTTPPALIGATDLNAPLDEVDRQDTHVCHRLLLQQRNTAVEGIKRRRSRLASAPSAQTAATPVTERASPVAAYRAEAINNSIWTSAYARPRSSLSRRPVCAKPSAA